MREPQIWMPGLSTPPPMPVVDGALEQLYREERARERDRWSHIRDPRIEESFQYRTAASLNANGTNGVEGGTTYTLLTIVTSGAATALCVSAVTQNDPGAMTSNFGGGFALTEIGRAFNPTSLRYIIWFAALNPPTGNLTLTTTVTNGNEIIVHASAFDGVASFSALVSNTGNDASPTLTIPTTAGGATVDCISRPKTGGPTQTQLYTLSGSGNIDGASSYALSSGSSNVHGWTIASTNWIDAGFAMVPVGGGASSDGITRNTARAMRPAAFKPGGAR
jgi:hypothetical protein